MSVADLAAGPGAPPDPVGADGSSGPPPWSWLFQRLSGLLLVPLVGLFVVDRYLLGGADDITALDLARRWSDPWWRFADFAFVVLATAHVVVGVHLAVRRRVSSPVAAYAGEIAGGIVVLSLAARAAWTVLTF